jgi:hypothetical protein
VVKRKILPCREFNPGCLACSLVTILIELSRCIKIHAVVLRNLRLSVVVYSFKQCSSSTTFALNSVPLAGFIFVTINWLISCSSDNGFIVIVAIHMLVMTYTFVWIRNLLAAAHIKKTVCLICGTAWFCNPHTHNQSHS